MIHSRYRLGDQLLYYSVGAFGSSLSQEESEVLTQLFGNQLLEVRSFYSLYCNDTKLSMAKLVVNGIVLSAENSMQKFAVIQKIVCSRSTNLALITPFKTAAT